MSREPAFKPRIQSIEDFRFFYKSYSSLLSSYAIKNNSGIWPVMGTIVLGVAVSSAYVIRQGLFGNDISFRPRVNREPWNAFENKNYKFFEMEDFDARNYHHPRPRF